MFYKVWNVLNLHCLKSDLIQSYAGPHSVRMREITDQNNPEYGYFSRNFSLCL